MADRWFYAHEKNKLGPFSGLQLKALATSGEILPTDTVWKDDIERGVPASRVRYLFLTVPAVPAASDRVPPAEPTAVIVEVQAAAVPEGPRATETPGADNSDPTAIPETIDLVPEAEAEAPTPEPPPPVKPKHVKKGRAVAGKGVVIVGQDGVYVKFKKKCTVCSHEDSSRSMLKIVNGVTRLNFYCPKCRKSHEAVMNGYLS